MSHKTHSCGETCLNYTLTILKDIQKALISGGGSSQGDKQGPVLHHGHRDEGARAKFQVEHRKLKFPADYRRSTSLGRRIYRPVEVYGISRTKKIYECHGWQKSSVQALATLRLLYCMYPCSPLSPKNEFLLCSTCSYSCCILSLFVSLRTTRENGFEAARPCNNRLFHRGCYSSGFLANLV